MSARYCETAGHTWRPDQRECVMCGAIPDDSASTGPKAIRTNADREQLVAHAQATQLRIVARLNAAGAARMAAEGLASAYRDLECCLANSADAARKAADAPTAQSARDLQASLDHLVKFAERRVAKALIATTKANRVNGGES